MIAVLGAGKMGEALISGMLRAGVSPGGVVAAVRRGERGEMLRDGYGIEVSSAVAAGGRADTLVITVKPQDMASLLAEITSAVTADQLVISVAAGITTSFIEGRLADGVPVIRVMSISSSVIWRAQCRMKLSKNACVAGLSFRYS